MYLIKLIERKNSDKSRVIDTLKNIITFQFYQTIQIVRKNVFFMFRKDLQCKNNVCVRGINFSYIKIDR